MEIERKWMVNGWPEQANASLRLLWTEYQEQGYVHTIPPIVRIRLEARVDDSPKRTPADPASEFGGPGMDGPDGGTYTQSVMESVTPENAKHVLCLKSAGLLTREEIEIEISREHFDSLVNLISQPMIRKVRRVYLLPGNLKLEVNLVDEGLPTRFLYAEVEFESEEQARSWDPASCGLGSYLQDDVTEKPGQSMSAYWARTRGRTER